MINSQCVLVLVLVFMALGVAHGGQEQPAEAPDLSASVMSDPDVIATGGELWAQQCRHCHGNAAYPGKAPKLKPRRYKPDFVFDRVTNGFRKMPAWGEVYSTEQRVGIVAYILSKKFNP